MTDEIIWTLSQHVDHLAEVPLDPKYGHSMRGTVCDIMGYLCVEDQNGGAWPLADHWKAVLKHGDTGTLTFTKGDGKPDHWRFKKDLKRPET